jgi:AGCS family alanine or glycine:cation symporter
MKTLDELLNAVSAMVWGPVMLVLLVGIGMYLTLGLKFFTWRKMGMALAILWQGRSSSSNKEGALPRFRH